MFKYRVAPTAYFIAVHTGALVGLLLGPTLVDWVICGALYWIRVVGITLGYHRLLSHRSFVTSRPIAFGLAVAGAAAVQKGPLWWVHHHRLHHRVADQPGDPHSPRHGWFHAHMGWILSPKFAKLPEDAVPDLRQRRELVLLERLHLLPILVISAVVYLSTQRLTAVLVGVLLSTVILYHALFSSNSLAHAPEKPRINASEDSQNSWVLGFLLCGDGWHASHHAQPNAAQHWSRHLDINFALIRAMSRLGLAHSIRERR